MRVQRRVGTLTRFALLFGAMVLSSCDPGYGFTVHNTCDSLVWATFHDSEDFDLSEDELDTNPTAIPAGSNNTWTTLDAHIAPPYGLYLVSGPRAGDMLTSDEPDIQIPASACPK